MKNDRTPRTLADAEFTVGYPSRQPAQPVDWSSWVMLALFIGFLVLLYLEVL